MARLAPTDLPEVTDAHRRAAFDSLRLFGCTFDAAMADTIRRRIVEARAHQLRTHEWKAERRTVVRYLVTSGDPAPIRAQPGRRFWAIPAKDLKRAAAGDRDD